MRQPERRGLTPSYGTLRLARERVAIPVHPIVRPRGGDFATARGGFRGDQEDIRHIREMGFPGVVVGMLDEEGHIDLPRMREVMRLCEGWR